jgi:hypothetical protein
MIADVSLVLGCLLLIFSITGALSAFADRRMPVRAAVMFLIGAVMVLYSGLSVSGGFAVGDLPQAIVRIIAYIIK